MYALSADAAGQVQTVFAFLRGDVLEKDFPRSFPNAALKESFFLQRGEISINGAYADFVCGQRIRDLTRAHLLICML